MRWGQPEGGTSLPPPPGGGTSQAEAGAPTRRQAHVLRAARAPILCGCPKSCPGAQLSWQPQPCTWTHRKHGRLAKCATMVHPARACAAPAAPSAPGGLPCGLLYDGWAQGQQDTKAWGPWVPAGHVGSLRGGSVVSVLSRCLLSSYPRPRVRGHGPAGVSHPALASPPTRFTAEQTEA